MLYAVTGINHNYVILNNTKILSCLDEINLNGIGRNIQTYDFSTLYTKLDHADIKAAMSMVINLAFSRNNTKSCISVYEKSASWVKTPRSGTMFFTSKTLIDSVNFLVDNAYFSFGENVFKQLVGIPIGVDPGPYVANLTLWYFEFKYVNSLYKSDYRSALMLNNTFRLIDDITSINSDNLFSNIVSKIYPNNLILNKENIGDNSANVLDLDISIHNFKFCVSVFDKRDKFNFDVVKFAPKRTNQPEKIGYNTFSSQVLRFFRICNDFNGFLFKLCVGLGYSDSKLRGIFHTLCGKHALCRKFPIIRNIL